ncbi:MAG: 1-deoxy-D-xylulose-5-phosphate reductoisomerase [Actinomycetaceae bacterium]|nr:1-deoxy-D-xylulose-5-phosphate reductoisomerase [Actinomycetaceae bacterium]MDY5854848.1 1-deoxy-D-xylulose-5-phosphate reductoisomerase [Arcanobacterium sp.]
MRNVWILGSTGSIGTQALEVIARNRTLYRVAGLGAGGAHVELLAQQARDFEVPVVAIADVEALEAFRAAWVAIGGERKEPDILVGSEAMAQLASSSANHDDVVLNGITGSVGLAPTLAALRTGATLALANKESLVAGGALVAEAMVRPGQIVPVDSEHSAIFQALQSGVHHRGLTSANTDDGVSNVRRVIVTASGGPFRGRTRAQLSAVSVREALRHPTWTMGPVVTINSATLMNKGLELIEAAYLFDIPPQQILPVVHPQSVVHSMVEFSDGSTLAQLSPPDMRLPIALGLSWPERLVEVAPACDWTQAANWSFEPLDNDAFPAVQLAREALAAGALYPAVMNAANEQAVAAFVHENLSFLGITDVVARTLDDFAHSSFTSGAADLALTLETVQAAEAWARAQADILIAQS